MRIGLVTEPIFNQQAGIHQFTAQLVDALLSFGDHEYIQLGSQPYSSELPFVKISSLATRIESPTRWLKQQSNILTKNNIDFYIDPSHFGSLGLLPGKKRIAVIHDITPLLFPDMHRKRTVLGHRLFMKSWLQNSRAIITVSDQTKVDISRRFKQLPPIRRIYPGMASEPAITGYDIPYKRYFLVPGALEPRKNLQRTIEAFSAIEDDGLHLICTGPEGWKTDFHHLVSRSASKNRIHHLGYVDRQSLVSLYKNAIALVYPSLYEGLGLPILEAMVAGCPVITSDQSATAEVAGEAALLIDPESVESIKTAMLHLLNDADLRKSLMLEGHCRANLFSWQTFVKVFEEDVIRSL